MRGHCRARLTGLGVAQLLGSLGNLLGAKADLGHGVLNGQAAHDIAVVHLLVTCEVLGNGLRRNVLQHDARARELARFGAEAAQVAAEDGMAALREQARYAGQKLNMVALDIPGTAAHL